MNTVLKMAALILYVLALASLARLLPADGAFAYVRITALVLVILHVLQLPFVFKYVRLYPGPLAASILLTLLFGILHWKPLAASQARGGQ